MAVHHPLGVYGGDKALVVTFDNASRLELYSGDNMSAIYFDAQGKPTKIFERPGSLRDNRLYTLGLMEAFGHLYGNSGFNPREINISWWD